MSYKTTTQHVKNVINNLDEDSLIENIKNDWSYYVLFDNPSERVTKFMIETYPIGIHCVSNPSRELIELAIETHWTQSIIDSIEQYHGIDNELQKFINRLKIEKGPLG